MEEANLKIKLLESIGRVYEQARKCRLRLEVFSETGSDLGLLSHYFGVTATQSFFVAVVMSMNYKCDPVTLNDLGEYFRCNPIEILYYSDDFINLCDKGIFRKEKSLHRQQLALASDHFMVSEEVTTAILQNKSMPDLAEKKMEDVLEVLGRLFSLAEKRNGEDISTPELFLKTRLIFHEYIHFPLIKKVADYSLHTADNYLFLYLTWKTLAGEEGADIDKATDLIYDDPVEKISYRQKIISGENALLKNNLVELVEARFFNDASLKLTEQSCQMLESCGLKVMQNLPNRNNITEPSGVLPRTLIFSDEMESRLGLVRNVLTEENLAATRERLSSKNLPKGITILFHGEPGTGKTELVMQLARETGRKVYRVDISQAKSLWYGESEKIIKRIFSGYKNLMKECDQIPVLLFNEADAIFSSRRMLRSSGVSQTENTIQNILLEELEQFEGIMMATTNCTGNFDAAFNRRFLFKVGFEKPDVNIKARIWKMKFPELGVSECDELSARFDFSGAQIDNILRKSEMHSVIYGETVNFNNIVSYCREEHQLTRSTKIGYSKT